MSLNEINEMVGGEKGTDEAIGNGRTVTIEQRKSDKPDRPDKPKKVAPPKTAPSSEPMIIVNVNDRLGTKAAIPCLASDPVGSLKSHLSSMLLKLNAHGLQGLFKAQVAARVGRQPHEILLKRQGERPFKDALTLEDYGVSNGVQLDLELDTGD
ncbi:MAG: hypothetical protein M1817_001915 [Caeruleum heppii]|nr:MAG: hypothetical protein M1817_001915 [Caeruleum heppii]